MAQLPIPTAWKNDVCRILEESLPWTIRPTKDFGEKFQISFPTGVQAEVEEAIIAYLKQSGATGCPVQMDFPDGETWEFFFQYQNKKTYGKIMLRTNRDRVVLYSAHSPKKPKLRCE